jgi:hypothetical protein
VQITAESYLRQAELMLMAAWSGWKTWSAHSVLGDGVLLCVMKQVFILYFLNNTTTYILYIWLFDITTCFICLFSYYEAEYCQYSYLMIAETDSRNM